MSPAVLQQIRQVTVERCDDLAWFLTACSSQVCEKPDHAREDAANMRELARFLEDQALRIEVTL